MIEAVNVADRELIASMNNSVDIPMECCVHEIVDRQAQLVPNSIAVQAWDGSLTYAELSQLSSSLATHLITMGVQPQEFVLMVFEKCRLAIVAITAILKAGAICVPLDPSNASKRLETVLEDTQAHFAVASSIYSGIFATGANVRTVVADTLLISKLGLIQNSYKDVARAKPEDAAFLMYSSGSTGRPKGIIQQHGRLCFSIREHSRAMGITAQSRTLQFAAYTFDTSMSDIYGTFMQGAVLCVCSDWDRLNDLARSIRSLNANYVCLTPTVAEQLEPQEVPSLRTLCVGGEALTATLVDKWAERLDLINVYGITECLVWTFTTKPIRPGQFSRSIGRPACGRAWITDVEDPSQLLPVGAIGELLIEGPNLAREYLNDPIKTAEAFISPPQWLQDMRALHPPPERLYRTGDLVRYAEDGTIEFLGRKDTQVKLNGQRVELGEIEYHMKKLLPLSAQVAAHVLPDFPPTRTTLVASICLSTDSSSRELQDDFHLESNGFSNGKMHAVQDLNADFEAVVQKLRPALMQSLPSLLVPTRFIPVQRMPLTVSGKLDRRMLQQIVTEYLSSYPLESSILGNGHIRRPPSTKAEKQLATLWSTILGVNYQAISADHEFVRLGGDSAQAMKLVTLARKSGLHLTVADILQHQQLSEMANVSKPLVSKSQDIIPPFALLKAPAEVRQIAAKQCGLTEELIQDAYPCTPLQEGLLALSLRHEGAYVAQTVIEIPRTMSPALYMKAWEQAYREYAILRTRIIETDEGLVQVVIDEDLIWNHADNYDRYLHEDKSLPMNVGSRLNRFAIILDRDSESSCSLSWTAHHCTYDGWSAALIVQEVSRIAAGQQSNTHTGFNHFISYLQEQDVEKSETYWKEQLREVEAPVFPTRSRSLQGPGTVQSVQQRISMAPRDVFTSSTLVRAALAILISKYSNTDDTVFGTVVSGRNAAIEGIETIIGPTFSTVPIRIQIDENRSVSDFLEQVQKRALEMMPYEALGLQNIRKLSEDTQIACDFQCLLITQPLEEQVDLGGIKITYEELSDAGTYPLTIDCKFESGTALLKAFFDSGVLDSSSAERVLLQLDSIIQQLRNAPWDQHLGEIDLAGTADKSLIWEWNASYPSAIDRRVCEVIEERCALSPSKEAVCSWDGNFTYKELDTLSSHLSQHLAQLGIGPEVIVPVSFERSKWVVVTVLAVNKAGGAFVLLNPTHPIERLQSVVSQTNSPIILSSRECLKLSQKLLPAAIVVEDFLKARRNSPKPVQQVQVTTNGTHAMHPRYAPSDLLYVVFTSGTSGAPKGIMIENRSFCTYIDALARKTNAQSTWRGLVSSAYSFDSSLEEMLMPLMIGGTVCMPSQHEISNDLTGAMNRMGVHWGVFTPSLARLIDPRQLKTLTDLYIGGEQMTDALVQTYGSCVRLTNTYGPSECCPTGCVSSTPELYGGHIGRGVACRTWIVDPINHERLVPVGCIGELILDGPNVGRGYLNDDEKTRAAFIDPPSWLRAMEPSNAGNDDHQYPRRMYKTGDLVRYCSNGTIEYIGRKDQQVKLYGQRIELSEIEHHIQSCLLEPAEVIVEVATRNPESHQQMLVAFIVFSRGDTGIEDTGSSPAQADPRIVNLRQALAGRIPSYMLPSLYLELQKLPLTSSDKVDRRQLKQSVFNLTEAEFLAAAGTSRQKRPPETEIELELQILWSEVLRIEKGNIGIRRVQF
jgi:amino acid adenylation domain-containing protein